MQHIKVIGTAGTSSGTIEAIGRATIIDNKPLKQIQIFVEKIKNVNYVYF